MKKILILVILIIVSCNKKKDILKTDNTTIYKIAGNNLPKITDFEFSNVHSYKKDSLYLNIGYLEFDSITSKDSYKAEGKINESLKYLYVNKFDLGDSIPKEINHYLDKNNEDNLFVYSEEYNGIPFSLKFNQVGKKIVIYVPYQIRMEQIKNSDRVHNIESYSVYIDTVEIK